MKKERFKNKVLALIGMAKDPSSQLSAIKKSKGKVVSVVKGDEFGLAVFGHGNQAAHFSPIRREEGNEAGILEMGLEGGLDCLESEVIGAVNSSVKLV